MGAHAPRCKAGPKMIISLDLLAERRHFSSSEDLSATEATVSSYFVFTLLTGHLFIRERCVVDSYSTYLAFERVIAVGESADLRVHVARCTAGTHLTNQQPT